MKSRLLVIASVLVSSGAIGTAQERTASPVFTAAQASAGRTAYESVCFNCHQESLAGRNGEPGELPSLATLPSDMQTTIRNAGGTVPQLAGPAFMERWGGRTTADLSRRIRIASAFLSTVKPPLPEDVDENAYLNLTAYVLQRNGARPGPLVLTATTAIAIRQVTSSDASTQNAVSPQAPAAVIRTYCVTCHGGQAPQGHFALDRANADDPSRDPDTWERVVRHLRARTMPPMSAPRPDNSQYESTISALTTALDRSAPATARPLTDTEIAVRLAQLIWSSAPDQPLSDAAAQGRLRDTHTLQAQVRRMLSDSKAIAFVTGFFDSWLTLDQLATMKGDSQLFPEFDNELREGLRRETELFVESQLREDRSPLDLWSANYTFLNERLARHYGVPGISGSEYRRVTWPGPERAGLLAQGSILTLTSRPYISYPLDVSTTSPAARAKWILTRFLGVNPPTPLRGIPPGDFPFEKRTPLVKQSRTFPATPCLACHRSFFPLSYGLENFDVLGRWRSDDGPDPIDASGVMVDGTPFNGLIELRRALLVRRDAFFSTLTEKLLAYSVGGTTAMNQRTPASQMPAVRAALREAAAENYTWSSLLAAVVKVSHSESVGTLPR